MVFITSARVLLDSVITPKVGRVLGFPLTHIISLVEKNEILNYLVKICNDFRLVKKD